MALMCQGELEFESLEIAYLMNFKRYFAAELERLAELEQQGLVEVLADRIKVTPMGWYFVRGVAMVFDSYLQGDRQRQRFSKII